MARAGDERSPQEEAMSPEEAIQGPPLMEFLRWLDEERRKQSALLSTLSERVERESVAMREFTTRLSELGSRLAQLQVDLTRLPAPEGILEQVRQELGGMVEQTRQERRRAEQETAKLRQHETESQAQALESWRAEILLRLEAVVKEQQVVNGRLVEQMTRFHNDLAYLHDRVVGAARRVEHLEARAEQSLKQMGEMERQREEFRRSQEEFLESLRRWQVDRRKEIDAFLRRIDRGEIPRRARTAKEDSDGEARALLPTLRELEEGLRVRRQEVLHLQKLSEDRLRQQLEEWRGEQERRWREMEARWGEWQKALAQRDQRLEELRHLIEELTRVRMEEARTLLRRVERRKPGEET